MASGTLAVSGQSTGTTHQFIATEYYNTRTFNCSDLIRGVVIGNSTTLLAIRKKVAALELEGDQKTGAEIVYGSLAAPLNQIAENAGHEGAVMVQAVEKAKNNHGLNAATGEIEDMLKAGILDPAKVIRNTCQNAVSVAGIFITTECMITDIPEPEPAGDGGHDHHHGGGGGMPGGMGDMPGMM